MIVGVVVENFQRCQELQEDQDKAKAVIEKWKLCLKKSCKNNYFSKISAQGVDRLLTLNESNNETNSREKRKLRARNELIPGAR